MFISKSNLLKGQSLNVTVGTGSDLSSNMTSSDFSLNYTASNRVITIVLPPMSGVSYVAASGLNFDGATVRITNSVDFSQTVVLERNNVVMFIFEERNFNGLAFQVVAPSRNPTISHIAAGKIMQIPNGGVTSGYSRQWLNRNQVSRTIASNIGAPVSTLIRREPLNGQLNLPNMPNSFVYGDWQEFSDFAASGEVFYITEQESLADSMQQASYACFAPRFNAPKAHSSTRELQDINIGFNCYNGI